MQTTGTFINIRTVLIFFDFTHGELKIFTFFFHLYIYFETHIIFFVEATHYYACYNQARGHFKYM